MESWTEWNKSEQTDGLGTPKKKTCLMSGGSLADKQKLNRHPGRQACLQAGRQTDT